VTKRAIDGALGVLQACLNSKTVKRVVYTSSGAAVVLNSDGQEVDEMDESFWSNIDFLKASSPSGHSGSYMISKTSTERASLEFAEKHGLDVVTLIPSFVVGPFICPKFPSSVRTMLAMVLGMCVHFFFFFFHKLLFSSQVILEVPIMSFFVFLLYHFSKVITR
jgi:nucleoside-diphosphate-sugar epimerase